MSDFYYRLPLGSQLPAASSVTAAGSADTAVAFEFRVTYTATGVDKSSTIRALDAIAAKVLQGDWPPA